MFSFINVNNIFKKILLLFYCFLGGTLIFSLEINGIVKSKETLLAYSAIIFPDLGIVEYSDEEGRFSIKIEDSLLTDTEFLELIINCDGFLDQQIILTAETVYPLEIVMEEALVDMGTIKVTEEQDKELNSAESYSREEIEKIPTGGDPLQVLSTVSGVVSGRDVLNDNDDGKDDRDPFTAAGGITLPEFIFRGIEPFGNLYYYDYFRLHSLYHKWGILVPRSLISQSVIDNIEISKGGYDSSVGPGYGGMVRFNTPDEIPESGRYDVNVSLTEAGTYIEQPLGRSSALYLSINKSLYDYTFVPFINFMIKNDIDPFVYQPNRFNYGDFDYSMKVLWYPTDSQSFSLDVLGLYDYAYDHPDMDYYNNHDPMPYLDPDYEQKDENEYFIMVTDYTDLENKYSTHGQGSSWDISTDKFYNSLSLYHIWLDSTDIYARNDFDGFQGKYVEAEWMQDSCSVNQIQTADDFKVNLPADFSLQGGATFSYYLMTARHIVKQTEYEEIQFNTLELPIRDSRQGILTTEEFTTVISYDEYVHMIKKYSLDGLQLVSDGEIRADNFEVGSYLNLDKTWGILTLFAGPRFDYFDFFDDYYLSWRGGLAISPMDNLDINLSGGSYPGSLNYLAITRGVYQQDEQIYIPTKISEAYCGNFNIGWAFHEKAAIDTSVYYNRIYKLSSANVLLDNRVPSEGKSWGIEFDFVNNPWHFFNWQLHYTFAHSEYLLSDNKWTSPDSEIYHTLVWQNYFELFSFLNLGINTKLLSGQKFTPFKVISEGPNGQFLYEQGDYNSQINYIPQFSLDISLKFHWESVRSKKMIYMGCTDFIRGSVDYTKAASVGQDTSIPSHRQYKIQSCFILDYFPAMNFGMKFSF